MASFHGHSFEHLEARRKSLGEKLAQGKITQETYDKEIQSCTRDALDEMLSKSFEQWRKFEISPFDLTRTVEEARRKTFDKNGRLKETPLTPIYRMMVDNWIKIESMEGPKDLTHFLLPMLGENDFYATHTRVKKICSRLKVKFKGPVKEV